MSSKLRRILLFLSQGQSQGVCCWLLGVSLTADCKLYFIRFLYPLADIEKDLMFLVAGSDLFPPANPGPSAEMFSLPVH